MGIAEKYYRKEKKLEPGYKLTNAEWKEVNALHHFLQFCKSEECKIRIIDAGGIVVNKEHLRNNLLIQQKFLTDIDKIMLTKGIDLQEKGKRIAERWNTLALSIQSIEHFDLKIPLDKLTIE